MPRTKAREPNPLPESFYLAVGAREETIDAIDAWSERAQDQKTLIVELLELPEGQGEPWIYQGCLIGVNLALNALANRRTQLEHTEAL